MAGSARSRTTRHSSSGMSLLEVVAVFSCTAILLAVAVPNINKLNQEWTLWGEARALESSLRWGRGHAVSVNSSMMFVVDPEGRRHYWVDPQSGDRFENTVRYVQGQVRVTGFPKKPLRFYPRGNAAPAGTYVLQGEAGTYRVVVNFVGRIRVQRD